MKFDLRSLAALRMALGLMLLSQALFLCHDFRAFYQTSDGISSIQEVFLLPRTVTEALLRALIFGIIPLFSVCLLAGLWTRLSTLICWGGLVVVQNANPLILQGGDVLLRLLLFWSLFLPLGRKWALDARQSKSPFQTLPLTSEVATWALTLQVCFVYWFAALWKSDPLWTRNGNALFYALNIEHFTTPFGLYLRRFPDLLRIATFGVLGLEILGPCLLFIPFRRDVCRLGAVILFVGFHLIGLQLLLRIGLFPWVCATAWLIFLPGSFWDRIEAAYRWFLKVERSRGKRARILTKQARYETRLWLLLDCAGALTIALSLLDVFAWNVASITGSSSLQWMNRYDFFGNALQLGQRWNMYAPAPRKEHGWLVVPAQLEDGSEVDLFTGQPISWAKPADIGALFGDDRWRRYLSNLFDNQNPAELQSYADYLVTMWNDNHAEKERVQSVTIIFMRQQTQPDLTITEPQRDVLYFRAY